MEYIRKFISIIALILITNISFAQANQTSLESAFSKSYIAEKNGDFSTAMDALKEVYDESSYELNLRLGWLNYNAGLFDEAIIFYGNSLKLKPYSEEARFGLILPLAALGKWDKVINIYDDILELSPNNTIALYRLGLVYYGRKDYAKAQPLFTKLVDLYPFGYDGLIMLAWNSYFMGNNNQAKVLFNKAKLYNPEDKSASEGLKLVK
jgi:tetratricopeptide (TPR) repeat protein